MSMRLRPQPNLLTGLIITIILLGGISAATVFVNARTYRELAFDFQRQYMTQMVAAESANILAEEDRNARSLGQRIQSRDDFRQAFNSGDAAAISAVLDAQYRQAPDTSGLVDVIALYVFDGDARLLARANPRGAATAVGGGALLCPGLITKARVRAGSLSEKPLYELCLFDGLPRLASLVPIGGASKTGYLQVVTDPLPNLLRIGHRLKMPVQIRRSDGAVIHTASAWVDAHSSHQVMSKYVLTANNSRPALNIAAQRNADGLVMQIEKTNNRLLFVVVLIILATVALALLMVKFSVLNPLRDISYQFRVFRKRDANATDTAAEQGEPVSFHALGQLYETLHDMAIRDPLTGTYNRALLEDRLKQVIAEHRRTPGKAAILLIDMVRFKYVNDLLGHHTGDLLLKEVVVRIGHVLRESDTLARLGGDEFVIILPDTDADQATQVAEKIIQSMVPEFEVEQNRLSTSVSIGIALMPEHGDDVETLLRNADYAMYSTKHDRRGYAIYDPATRDDINVDRMQLDGMLNEDISRNDLFLVYQPVIEFGSHHISYLEALVRWRQPDGRVVMPGDFVPVAERSGLIRQLSEWIIDAVCRELAILQQHYPGMRAGINLSMYNLHDLNLKQQIRDALSRHRLRPESLLLEITETGVMLDPEQVIETLGALAEMGLSLSIDDFGTGHSSLVYLKRLPVHTLKVDKSFVVDMDSDEDNFIIVRATIDLAHSLGLTVTAEGVETVSVYAQLRGMGCDYYQGYYVGRPKDREAILEWLQENSRGMVDRGRRPG
jgi:diguanylate cyclase (GGDEF)-like protein